MRCAQRPDFVGHISFHIQKIRIDNAPQEENWEKLRQIYTTTKSPDVVKYILDKAAEHVQWTIVNEIAKCSSGPVAKYAVDRAATEGNWTVVKEFVIFGSESIRNYAAKKLEDAGIANYTLPQVDE